MIDDALPGCVVGGGVGGMTEGLGLESQPSSQLLMLLSGLPLLSKITKQSCGTARKIHNHDNLETWHK